MFSWKKKPLASEEEPKDNSNDPDPTNDTLATLIKTLLSLEQQLNQHLQYWQKKKEDLLEGALEDVLNTDPATKQEGIHEQFTKMITEIRSLYEPPDQNLKHILEQKQSEINNICKQLISECKELPAKDHEKEKKIRLDVCMKSMEDLNELIAIINAIKVEIEYALKVPHAGMQFLIWLGHLVANVLIHDSPNIDMEMTNLRREILYNQVMPVVIEIRSSIIDRGNAAEEIAHKKMESNPGRNYFGIFPSATTADAAAKPPSATNEKEKPAPAPQRRGCNLL